MATPKDPQQFCVRWNSYQSNLQSAFPKLLTNEHFVDVTLACESRMVKCHKVVLSACSAYFEKLLVQNPCQHPIIFMKDMKYWEVQALVDFMYKGEVNVTQDELASLLKAAEALEVRGLCGQGDGPANKLMLPRGTEAAAKKRKLEDGTKGGDPPTPGASTTPGPNPEFGNSGGGSSSGGGSNGCSGEGNNGQPSTPVGAGGAASSDLPNQESSINMTPGNASSNVKQECNLSSSDNGLFEDFDDDFYQDDNSLQIDETGNAYSLTTPNVQLDCSPGENNELSIDVKEEFLPGDQPFSTWYPKNRGPAFTQQPYKQYSQQSLEQAIYDLQTGKFSSIRACARHHGIPMTTLRYRSKVMSFVTKSA